MCYTVFDQLATFARFAETQILIRHNLSYRETIVQFRDVNFSGSDTSHLVSLLGGQLRNLHAAESLTFKEA
jgi:hypothetical protein